ncbi:MAG: hypothetical protein H0W78_13425 [Planctomycetes bacterium]|jgi:hypothetical protein|nr:hypothetical protein [Planctomycetota bacterium]
MFDDPHFFPFLQHNSWKGAASCLVRPLVPPPGDLLITYGIAGDSQNQYLTQEAQEKSGYSEADMHEQAVENLRHRHGKIPWSPVTIGGEDVLLRTGDPVISSDVLNPRGMKKLSGAFAGETVYLGIPSVFTVVASNDPDLLSGIVHGLHREAEQEKAGPLSALVYVLTDGAITSAYDSETRSRPIAAIDAAKFTTLVVEGVAAVAVVMSRARGESDTSALAPLWPLFLRKLGARSPALHSLADATTDDFSTAITSLMANQRPLAGVRSLAKLVRHALPPDDGARVANAAIAAALALGQAGTGFFGVGRSLPKHLRLPLWGLAGLLGGEVP